ncbi:MAG: hypothetical protein ACREQT_12405 [Candidatus Binataceae bacterium]
MLLKAFDAEQFRANRLFGVRGKNSGSSLQSPKKDKIHQSLPVPQTPKGEHRLPP